MTRKKSSAPACAKGHDLFHDGVPRLRVHCPVDGCAETHLLRHVFMTAAGQRHPVVEEFLSETLFASWLGGKQVEDVRLAGEEEADRVLEPLDRATTVWRGEPDIGIILAFQAYARFMGHTGSSIVVWLPEYLGVAGELDRLVDVDAHTGFPDAATNEDGAWALWIPRMLPDSRRLGYFDQLKLVRRFAEYLGAPPEYVRLGSVAEQLYLARLHELRTGRLPFTQGDAIRTQTAASRGGQVKIERDEGRTFGLWPIDDVVGESTLGVAPIVAIGF